MFLVPSAWKAISSEDTGESACVAFVLPFAPTDGTLHSANAVVTVEKTEAGVDIATFSNKSLSSGPKIQCVSDEQPGANTRLVKSSGEQAGTTYTVLDFYRLNEAHSLGISVRLAYPMLEGVDSWSGVRDFETLLARLLVSDD
jgi:hypothetical protein